MSRRGCPFDKGPTATKIPWEVAGFHIVLNLGWRIDYGGGQSPNDA